MADVFTKLKRSEIMRKVKGKNSSIEIEARKFLYSKGLRYRLHGKNLPGKPDIVIRKYKTVIFIDGCFWHGHINCKDATLPKSNLKYWNFKITSNIKTLERT